MCCSEFSCVVLLNYVQWQYFPSEKLQRGIASAIIMLCVAIPMLVTEFAQYENDKSSERSLVPSYVENNQMVEVLEKQRLVALSGSDHPKWESKVVKLHERAIALEHDSIFRQTEALETIRKLLVQYTCQDTNMINGRLSH